MESAKEKSPVAMETPVSPPAEAPPKDVANPPKAPTIFANKASWKQDSEKEEPTSGSSEVNDMQSYMKEIVYWEQPLLSAKIFLVLCWIYYSTLSGGYSLVGLFCYVLTVRLVAVAGPRMAATELAKFERGIAKKAASACNKSAEAIESTLRLPSAEQVSFVVRGAADIVEKKTSAAAEAVENAGKDTKMLKIVLAHLLGIMFVNRLVCLWDLAFGIMFLAMTVPAIYSRQHERIDPVIEKVKNKAQPYVEKVEQKGCEVVELTKSKASQGVNAVRAKYQEFRNKRGASAEGQAEKKQQ